MQSEKVLQNLSFDPATGPVETRESSSSGRHLAFPVDTSAKIKSLRERYRRSRRAIPVSFRDLVPWLKVGERATHYLHPYPAKLLPHIAHFFLASRFMCPQNGLVLDPFGGSGTVALETCLSGRRPAYADTNPLAALIAEAKIDVPSSRDLEGALEALERRFLRSRTRRHPDVVNVDKWFRPEVTRALSRLRASIDREPSPETRRLLQVTFSATVRRVSNADPRLSVPVLLKSTSATQPPKDAWLTFAEQFASNVRRLDDLATLAPERARLLKAGPDARSLVFDSGGSLARDSVDLIITSPPYAGAQKYIRASSLSLGWLSLAQAGELKPLENVTIGREHLAKKHIDESPTTSVSAANRVISRVRKINPTRAAICATYLNEMEAVLQQIALVLKPGGRLVLVIGNNEVCGEKFLSSEYLRSLLKSLGLRLEMRMVDEIKSRGLMTKRNKSASVITREWVLVFRK